MAYGASHLLTYETHLQFNSCTLSRVELPSRWSDAKVMRFL
jgi:hypothetical protein